MKRDWKRGLAILLVATLIYVTTPLTLGSVYAVENEVITTNNLTVNGETVEWVLNGDWAATFGDADGSGAFDYWDSTAINFTLTHEATGLTPGTYTMSVKTFGSSGDPQSGSILFAISGGETYSTPITYSGSSWGNPRTLTVDNIEVGEDGVATLGFTVLAGADHYGFMDEVTFTTAASGPELKVAPSSINMRPGKTQHITYKVISGVVTDVSYTSSNTSVATVDEHGLVTALANGSVTITVTANPGGEEPTESRAAFIVSDEWQQLGDTEIFVQPVPQLQDGKRSDFIMGTDISTIYEIQKSGRKFYDLAGNEKPLMEVLKENGVNWIRLRLWNDPKDEAGHWYGAGNTNKDHVILMAKQAKELGLHVLIDFHYSDFWAGPGRQSMPKSWAQYDEEQLMEAVYDYTYDVIESLANEDAYPDMVQIGNEINDGMLWPLGRTPAGAKKYIEQGIAAVRDAEVDLNGDAIKIMIHRANPNNGVGTLTSFYNHYADLDYDVIGLSFYPFWHGTFSNIQEVMNAMASTFDKEVVVAETSYAYTLEDVPNNGGTSQVFSESQEAASGYKASVSGQASMVRDVIAAVAEVPDDKGLGMFYWEPAWLPGVDTGWATMEAADYQGEAISSDGGSGWANQAMFNFFGEALPSIQVYNLVRGSDDMYVAPTIEEIRDVAVSTSEGVEVSLPLSVQVLYSDGAYRALGVDTWSPSTYDYNTVGAYSAVGTLVGGGTVTASITVNPRNYVANPGIESSDISAWVLENSDRSTEAAYTGSYSLHFWNREVVSAKQTVTGLPNGKYQLSMRSRIGGEPIGESYMYAQTNGITVNTPLTMSGWVDWNLNTISNIAVENGTLEIGAVMNTVINAGGDFDDWVLIKTANLDAPDGNSGNGNNNGNNSQSTVTPQLPGQGIKVITSPSTNAEGNIIVNLAEGDKQVQLPANAAAIGGNHTLNLSRDDVEVEIPGEVLDELKALIDDDELEGAQISFGMNELGDEEVALLMGKANQISKANLTTAGAIYDFDLSIRDKDGVSTPLTDFKKPILLKLKVNEGVSLDLLGVYYIDSNGNIEFAAGDYVDGYMVVSIHHFSKYAVLEYDMTFDDITGQYWAQDVIKKMAAKHIVAGVSDTEFAPKRHVTRAEFTAYIVRALGLTAASEGSFSDVDRSAWYAESVIAAYEAGIVSGRGMDIFAPSVTITRQEMAIMMMKAYKVLTGRTFTASGEVTFADSADISLWAQAAVNSAAELGFVQGRENNQFVPHGQLNRAESVQVISLLMK